MTKNRTAGSNHAAALLSLTLSVGTLDPVLDVMLDAMGRGAGISADIGDHTALGIFFWFQITDFDVFCLFLVLHFVIYPLLAC